MKSSKENEYPWSYTLSKENNARYLQTGKMSQHISLMPYETKFAEFSKKCNQKNATQKNYNTAGNDSNNTISRVLGKYSNNCKQQLLFEDIIPLSNKCFADEPTHALESVNSAEINPQKIQNSTSQKQRSIIKNKDTKNNIKNTETSFSGNSHQEFDAETTSSFNLSQTKSKDIGSEHQQQYYFQALFGCIGEDLRKVSESVPIVIEESAEETETVRTPKRFQSLVAPNHNQNKKQNILVSEYISPECSKDMITEYFKRSNAAKADSDMANFDEYLNSFKLKYKKKFRCKKKYNNFLKEKDNNFQEYYENKQNKEQELEKKSNIKSNQQLHESFLGRMSTSKQSNSFKVDKDKSLGNQTNLAKILAESSWNYQTSSELKEKQDLLASSEVKNIRSKSAAMASRKNDEKQLNSSDNFSRRMTRIFRNNTQKSGLLNESMQVHHSQDVYDESSSSQCLSTTAPRHTLRRCFPLDNSQEMIFSPNTLNQTAAQIKIKTEKDKMSATQYQMKQPRANSAGEVSRKQSPYLFEDQQSAEPVKINQVIRESSSITEIPGISSSTAATSAGSTRKVSMCRIDLNKKKCDIFHESDQIIDQIQIISSTPQSIRQAFFQKQQKKLKSKENNNNNKENLKQFTFSAIKDNNIQYLGLSQKLDSFQFNYQTKPTIKHSKSPLAQRRSFSQAIKKEQSIIASLNENSLKIITPSSISQGFKKQSALEKEYLQFLAACPLSTTSARKRRSTSQGKSRPTTSNSSLNKCFGVNLSHKK